jgi:hypothetical protein
VALAPALAGAASTLTFGCMGVCGGGASWHVAAGVCRRGHGDSRIWACVPDLGLAGPDWDLLELREAWDVLLVASPPSLCLPSPPVSVLDLD